MRKYSIYIYIYTLAHVSNAVYIFDPAISSQVNWFHSQRSSAALQTHKMDSELRVHRGAFANLAVSHHVWLNHIKSTSNHAELKDG